MAVAPGGTNTPIREEAFSGLPTNVMFSATRLAVSGVPSEHVMPLRRVYFAVVVVASHFSARPATILPLGSKLTSES